MNFAGRLSDLNALGQQLRSVVDGTAASRGRAVVISGRRRVGKSRLAEVFCERSDTPYVVFQATRGRNPSNERDSLIRSISESSLDAPELLRSVRPRDWNEALGALASAVPNDRPSIIVLDEIPWLIERDKEFEGALQTVWDRELANKPVFLILIGSDISVMEALQTYGRPFFGRAAHLRLRPLHPADVRQLVDIGPADAIDAYLITGGFPEIVRSWTPGSDRSTFLRDALTNPLSPLLVAGELSLLSEFPEASHARRVLEAVGHDERTFGAIAAAVGGDGRLPAGTLNPLLKTLSAKQIIESDLPLATRPDTKNRRYRISDPYLRFWLAFLGSAVPLVERGRSDVALQRIEQSWTTWRGRAVEPVIREALLRLLPDDTWPTTETVGSWWNRQNNPEIDLIGADRAPVAKEIHFLGSVKWYDNRKFGKHEYDELVRSVDAVPGATADTPLVAVTRAGVDPGLPLAATWGPDDLITAWA